MLQIKICGVARPQDVDLVAQAGADAIGFNFFPRSPRFVNAQQAAALGADLPDEVLKVGVFVDNMLAELQEVAQEAGLDVVQLHGEEPPSLIAELSPLRVIKAFRCRDPQLEDVAQYLEQCSTAGKLPDAVLLDAYSPGEAGGTGKKLDWETLAGSMDRVDQVPVILAGGLTAQNVAQAISIVRPAGVDVASGVESFPGVKDARLVHEFVMNAKSGFAAL